MSHQWQALNQRFYLCPDLWEYWRIISILTAKAMNLTAPVVIIVGLWLNEGVERIHNLTVPDNNNTH